MRRVVSAPRQDWMAKVESQGFTYHTAGQTPENTAGCYWFEGAHYEFNAAEIDAIELATNNLHRLCLMAVDYIVDRPALMDRFMIPRAYQPLIIESWRRGDPSWMGRFDLAFNPQTGSVKMLEYNADTPTMVIETAIVQWFWLQDIDPTADQFNSLHEKLLARIGEIGRMMPPGAMLHFAALQDYVEEYQHSLYFMDLATQAGIPSRFVSIPDIGWRSDGRFVDMDDEPINFLHKLYPWEWLAQEEFGRNIPQVASKMGFIEPVWKMLLSNKAVLPVLWELAPENPYLLPAGWTQDAVGPRFVQKPILAREGANIRMRRGDGRPDIVTEGSYAAAPPVYQALADLPVFDGQHVVIGSWIAGDAAAGIILRESENPIVVNTSKVVPHLFR